MIDFGYWFEWTRCYSLLFFALQIRFERVYINGYRWTPICIVRSIKFISMKDLDNIEKKAVDEVRCEPMT